ncbi:predicted protein [Chaetomium globosum CBS 148.51]|uniref:Uncharacterized protein n=1 Tax=Chaetomium globosum (strain ATCC 6205 / CBS 148.51 / DSM 1962 / NBRC 6347 / NRRL 1970) TaxID=306901 RepID=Q2HHV1_CHAGB|nr:uncharacterized protein CHGG_00203 [Chaetomium globosum CBS 148.51]EAQ91968.1 predicted protein [Chaetomium globosum CBS 148.51]
MADLNRLDCSGLIGFAAVRIHPARDFQGCWSTRKERGRGICVCPREEGGRSLAAKTQSCNLATLRSMGKVSRLSPTRRYTRTLAIARGQLGARIRSHVQNIALLRVSADDARADRKMQGLEQENEDVVDRDLQDSPFRGMGLPSREEIDAVLKVQKKEDSSVTAKIQGRQTNPSFCACRRATRGAHGCPFTDAKDLQKGSARADRCGSSSDVMQHTSMWPWGFTRHWTLNKFPGRNGTALTDGPSCGVPRRARHAAAGRGGSAAFSNTSAARAAPASLASYTPSRTCSG